MGNDGPLFAWDGAQRGRHRHRCGIAGWRGGRTVGSRGLLDGRVLQAGAPRDLHARWVVPDRRSGLVRGRWPPPLFWAPDGHDQDGWVQCVAGRSRGGVGGMAGRARGVRVRDPRRGARRGCGGGSRAGRLRYRRSVRTHRVAPHVLSSYKIPRHLRVVEDKDLPKLPTGKADLVSCRDLFKQV